MTPEQQKGFHGICEIVKVKADNDQGFVVINAVDFDPAAHEKHGEQAEQVKAPPKVRRQV